MVRTKKSKESKKHAPPQLQKKRTQLPPPPPPPPPPPKRLPEKTLPMEEDAEESDSSRNEFDPSFIFGISQQLKSNTSNHEHLASEIEKYLGEGGRFQSTVLDKTPEPDTLFEIEGMVYGILYVPATLKTTASSAFNFRLECYRMFLEIVKKYAEEREKSFRLAIRMASKTNIDYSKQKTS